MSARQFGKAIALGEMYGAGTALTEEIIKQAHATLARFDRMAHCNDPIFEEIEARLMAAYVKDSKNSTTADEIAKDIRIIGESRQLLEGTGWANRKNRKQRRKAQRRARKANR